MNSRETAPYELIFQTEHFDLRRYKSHLVARLSVSMSRSDAIRKGYNALAAYFYGHNTPRNNGSKRINNVGDELTVIPPMILTRKNQGYDVSFIIPDGYSMEEIPEPKDKRIEIVKLPEIILAAARFTGDWDEKNFDNHGYKLLNHLEIKSVTTTKTVMEAFYDRSHIIPTRRRNEVLIPVLDYSALKSYPIPGRESLKPA